VKIYLEDIASISALGYGEQGNEHYRSSDHFHEFQNGIWSAKVKEQLPEFSEKYIQQSDKTGQWLIHLLGKVKHNNVDGVFMASSRGATELWENQHQRFLESGTVSTLCSPHTTLGNLASLVGQKMGRHIPSLSFSNACSSFSQALIQGAMWLKAREANNILVGASEFATSAFTQAQIEALHISSKEPNSSNYPNRSLDIRKEQNTLTLGEGAVMAKITRTPSQFEIAGIGYGMEMTKNPTGVSEEGTGFQAAMEMALGKAKLDQPDVIIAHAPGTIKGDRAEINAIQSLFPTPPFTFSNKWKIGHTYGASSGLSLDLATWILKNQTLPETPFSLGTAPTEIKSILINSMGFGGNVTSLILQLSDQQ